MSSDIKELHKIWLKFLNTTKTKEGDVWLDIFLNKYLDLLSKNDGKTSNLFSFQWKSSSNILAHQLLSDMYQLCEAVKNNVSSEVQSSEVSNLFQKYLLEGRGWKILWTLESIGIKNLLCLKDLVKLLISHVPVLLSLSVFPSNIPDFLRKYPKHLSLESCFSASKNNCSVCSNITKMEILLPRKKIFQGKKRVRKKKAKSQPPKLDSSSGEDSMMFEPCVIPAIQVKTLKKGHFINSDSMKISMSEIDESDLEFNLPDASSCCETKALNNYTISVTDYLNFILNLFQESVLLQQLGHESCSSSILEFSLNTLKLLHSDYYALKNWTPEDKRLLSHQLLKLIFLSASIPSDGSTYVGAPTENEIISSLFGICITKLSLDCIPCIKHEDIDFVCVVFKGSLLLICNTIQACANDYGKIICTTRTFSEHSTEICCNLISTLDTGDNGSSEIMHILDLIKDTIILLKTLRISAVHSSDYDVSLRTKHIHHHHNLLGPPVSHSIINREPMCCVASISCLMLRVLNSANSKQTTNTILRHLKSCGICCCVDPSFIIKTVFYKFSSLYLEAQQIVLNLLGNFFYCQLGLSSDTSSQCNFCVQRLNESYIGLPFTQQLTLHSPVNLNSTSETCNMFWNTLSIYDDLLKITNVETLESVAKHLCQLFSNGCLELKTQVFMRVILPQFLCLQIDPEDSLILPMQIKVKCFLNILVNVFSSRLLLVTFVAFNGIPILFKLLSKSQFRLQALSVIKALILSENNAVQDSSFCISEFEGIGKDFSNLSSCIMNAPAVNTFCSFLSEHTVLFLKILKDVFGMKDKAMKNTYYTGLDENIDSNVFAESENMLYELISNMPSTLEFIKEMWNSYKELFLNLKKDFFRIVSDNVLHSGYELLKFILETLNDVFEIQMMKSDLAIVDSVLWLIHSLLTIFICPNKEVSEQREVLEMVKCNLMKHSSQLVTHQTFLFDIILKCSFVNVAHNASFTDLYQEQKTKNEEYCEIVSSDNERTDITLSSECYLGDTENSSSFSGYDFAKSTSSHQIIIEHAEVIKMLFELIVLLQADCKHDWTAASLHVIHILTKLSQDNESNKPLLQNQGVPAMLLKGFSNSLNKNGENIKDFQIASMNLFITLTDAAMSPFELKQIIEFFKSSQAPLDVLLKTLEKMVNGIKDHPLWSISFPCEQKINLNYFRIKKRFKVISNARHLYSSVKNASSAWRSSALFFPVSEDTKWNCFNKGFDFSLWLKLNSSKSSASKENEFESSSNESQVFHVVSFGSDKFLLELWHESYNSQFILRLKSYIDGEITCLAKAVYKHQLLSDIWHHLCIKYSEKYEKSFFLSQVKLIIDGLTEKSFNFKYKRLGVKTVSPFHILLGHSKLQLNEEWSSSYLIGSFMLFKGDVLCRDILFYLSSLGPDTTTITECAVGKCNVFLPGRDSYTSTCSDITSDVQMGLKVPSLEKLQHSLLCSYTPENIDFYFVYPTITRRFLSRISVSKTSSSNLLGPQGWPYQKEPITASIFSSANVQNIKHRGFLYAVQRVGGISVILFLFAYVLEHSKEQKNICDALNILLMIINRDAICFEDFIQIKGFELLSQMIMNCSSGLFNDLLPVFLDNCIAQNFMSNEKGKNASLMKVENSVVITNPYIFFLMLKSISYSKNAPETVLTELFSVLDLLLNPKHSNVIVNVEKMNAMKVLDTLLWLQKNYVLLENHSLPHVVNKMIPVIIEKLLCYKFNSSALQNISHFLLLMRNANYAFVCHSRPAFFYLYPFENLKSSTEESAKSLIASYAAEMGENYSVDDLNILYEAPVLQKSMSVPGASPKITPLIGFKSKSLESLNEKKFLSQGIFDDSKSHQLSPQQSVTIKSAESWSKFSTEKIQNQNYEIESKSSEICVEFLKLIYTFMENSTPSSTENILSNLQPEIFIILTYSTDPKVCAATLNVIKIYLDAGGEKAKDEFLSIKGFHLLSNQLYCCPFSIEVINSCFSIVFGCTLNAVNINKIDRSKEVSSYQVLSWLPVLALLPKSYSDPDTCSDILQILSHFVQLNCVVMIELLDNGLCISLIHLLLKICHYHEQKNSSDFRLLELLPSIKHIDYIFKILANQLYSCSSSKEFSTFCDIQHLFMVCERKCTENCGSSSFCVQSLRSVQCSMLNTSIEFTELYSSLSKSTSSADFNVSSEELCDSTDVTSKSDPKRISAQTDVEKAVAEVPVSEIIVRFQILLEIATDFVIFKDPKIIIQTQEQDFIKDFFQFIIKGLCIATDTNAIKSKYSTIMFAVKDSLKKQLSRLLMANLALHQNTDMQQFMIEVLACHPSSRKLLHLVVFSIKKVGNFLIFLHDIQRNAKSFRLKKYCLMLYRNVESLLSGTPHLDTMKNEQLMKKLTAEWVQLWREDRKKWIEISNSLQERYLEKMKSLAEEVSTVALHITQKVFDIQNNIRKEFMEEYKSKYCEEASDRMNWIKLCNHFTHERAVWYEEECYPYSWELDPTEGPLRERRRLRRCDLNVEARFLRPEFAEKLERFQKDTPFVTVLNHHYELPYGEAVPHRLFNHEQIKFTCLCKIVSAFEETSVEILIGECSIHVIGESTSYHRGKCPISESWSFSSIKEIVPRRYELQNNAFEIFLTNGMTYLIAFLTEKDFQFIWKQLEEHGLPCQSSKDVSFITQLWRESTITNFEYLTQLNKFAGRSFNDLMQYPVFPFILADYSSSYLNLYDPSSFRNLSKPVAVQHKYRERFYMDTYNVLKEQSCGPENEPELPISGPYHYGSHYSNSGTVLYFLIRLLPYTYNFIAYQDNNFDIPDRSFHSIYRSWHLVTEDSTSDVKELVPEFFFLPEFLCNKNGFDFGVTQAGIRVNDVLLPPWCKQNARLFILIHRQALESEMVTNKLHNWIDLIFGYKQTGDAAIEAINVFHPATYYGLDISKWRDPIIRKALQVMIKTLGQMPQQLFVNPHPMVSLHLSGLESGNQSSNSVEVIDTVKGLRWGNYVGSPSTGTPNLVWCRKQSTPLGNFLPLLTNYVFGLGINTCLLLNHRKGASISSATYIMSAALISWGHDDGIVRIKLCRDQPVLPLLKSNKIDPICLCASVPDRCELFVAHSSGILHVYSLDLNPTESTVHQKQNFLQLNGHSDVITSIYICKAFSIFVTASEDKTVILWDLNQLTYIRSIMDHCGPVNLICVSDTLGDVVSISYFNSQSCMKVHTINGDIIGSVDVTETITSVCYSSAPEGISVNVIATGFHSGIIRLWSSWDLKPVREIICEKFFLPIKCLAFSADNQHLYASNSEGIVCVWEKPSKGLTNVPKLLIFA